MTIYRTRIRWLRVAALLVVVAAITTALGYQLLASPSSTLGSPVEGLLGDHHRAPGEADGVVPDGTTVFDNEVPGVAKLDPALLDALRRAATDAAAEGVELASTVAGAPRGTRNDC